MAEPRTSPPPVTRSNSALPVARRIASGAWPSSATNSMLLPLPRDRPLGTSARAASSTMLFQALHDSHLPIQREKLAPQFWQT